MALTDYLTDIADAIREQEGSSAQIAFKDMPSRVAAIGGVTVTTKGLTGIADAIRAIEGTTDKIKFSEMAERIRNLPLETDDVVYMTCDLSLSDCTDYIYPCVQTEDSADWYLDWGHYDGDTWVKDRSGGEAIGGSPSSEAKYTIPTDIDTNPVARIKAVKGYLGFVTLRVGGNGGVKAQPVTKITGTASKPSGKICAQYYYSSVSRETTDWDIEYVDFRAVTDLSYAFNYGKKLTDLSCISEWDTSNVKSISSTFANCSSLLSLDLDRWNTENITDMGSAFSYCDSLIYFYAYNWNTHNCTHFAYMFLGCALIDIGFIIGWDMSNATNVTGMFMNCANLLNAELTNVDLSNAYASYMFYGCKNLSSASFGKVSKIEGAMFRGCTDLSVLVITSQSIVPMANTNALYNTMIATPIPETEGTGVTYMGNVYVPSGLVDSYKAADNWSTYAEAITALGD